MNMAKGTFASKERMAVNEQKVLKELQEKYKKVDRDFLFKSTTIAKKLNASVYVVRDLLSNLEEKDLVAKTDFSRGTIVWRTKFDGKKQ